MPVDERMLDADAPKLFFDDVIRFLKGVKAMSAAHRAARSPGKYLSARSSTRRSC
ncbi:hypothetical protein PSTH1771_04065 [Pseudomonas syringae pv. theae]|uniref:hypothetical protein n=1 Tax=Pseudomonas syringae TaxID=317 RepID=UPI000408B538|nr:hypothetical protein [Pseudomonas syringae]GKQ44929.1 hypothetical protein PSTH2693_07255 [Pseudomonas syringae pv. theae]GKS04151.1 hypothetical protein PSTH1771_04065 [Pseudomonas syringae pv. theae]